MRSAPAAAGDAAPVPSDAAFLTLPLDGVRLIEASAGTGKTHTLASLFVRLVVERRLRVSQILAVTYTEAATQELRRRIRERLALAATLVGRAPADDAPAEVAASAWILHHHLHRGEESAAALARRLRIAAAEIDLAAIFTIHGFCARVLVEHGWDGDHDPEATLLLGKAEALHTQVAADLWRAHADGADAEALAGLWRDPRVLADELPTLLKPLPLWPEAEAEPLPDPRPELARATAELAQALRRHGAQYRRQLTAALEAGVLNRSRYKAEQVDSLMQRLLAWADDVNGPDPQAQFEKPSKLTFSELQHGTNKPHAGRTPQSPVQAPLAGFLQAQQAWQQWQWQCQRCFLHVLRADARRRLAQLKRQWRVRTYDDLIDGVADALAGPRGDILVKRLRRQYRVALVDEFQDTDARQWAIFNTVFGDCPPVRAAAAPPALLLIGDPKQAIYGFRGGDVHTYLAAAEQAERAPPLTRNFRSRPCLLQAIAALYANAAAADSGGEGPFCDRRIGFHPLQPGGIVDDAACQCDGQPAPGLVLHLLRSGADRLSADASREAAATACAATIRRTLAAAGAGRARIDGRPIEAGDFAVLVRSHREAAIIRQALARVGIAAVAAGRQSLFASEQAHALRLLLLAMTQPADEGRLRAALATPLLGQSAARIAALDEDAPARRRWQDRLLHWRERWRRGGMLALVTALAGERAEWLLALEDGERWMSNLLQLGEVLQHVASRRPGLHGLLDELQRRIATADPDDETQQLRLESDARRVQIVTLHKSKGLEYPLVCLPFVGIGEAAGTQARSVSVYDPAMCRRVLYWKIFKEEDVWRHANALAQRERQAEQARLLYVGLTRARHALWIAAGDLAKQQETPLAAMLSDLDALRASAAIRVEESLPNGPPALPSVPVSTEPVPPARISRRRLDEDWQVHSFTRLARADAGRDTLAAAIGADVAADDEPAWTDIAQAIAASPGWSEPAVAALVDDADDIDPRFSGSRFGNVLHAALETTDFAAWAGWRDGDAVPPSAAAALCGALRTAGYPQADIEAGIGPLATLVGRTLTVDMPEGGPLHALPADMRRAEIEFHLPMPSVAVPELLQLLHAHGIVGQRRRFGARQRLQGMLTGRIDLTYQRDGHWYLLDYKSNHLPSYDQATLYAAMAAGEYDLQALIYTVALHRWLSFRLGDGYAYRRDFGGVRYLFVRGLRLDRTEAAAARPGVYAHRFPETLVHALDRLLGAPLAGRSGR